ncbi:unnamed protein product [Durusdinium trenchii]|uniref:Uncharacterized protein n=1 Tax=Durusdinium trenchii TaxID=1381693 RepID=A0ABP0RXD3_9DINO
MGGEDEATHAAQTRRSVDLGESVDYEKMLAEAAQVPSFTPLPGSISQSEHEVQMASLEVRLRQHCLDIIGPTVRRTAALEKEVVKIQEDLQIKSTHISDLLLTAGKVEQQVANIENFRSELAKYDSERKQWQATATDSLSCMKQESERWKAWQGEMVSCKHEPCLALAEVGLTFHSNAPWALPALLSKRGLTFAKSGEQALLSAWRPRGGPPSQRHRPKPPASGPGGPGAVDVEAKHRGVIELRRISTCRELGNKKQLALYLEVAGASSWAPRTFLKPNDVLAAGKTDQLFFLKHACRERNEGVSVHLGAQACHTAWTNLPPEEQDEYVAQQEVAGVLLDHDGRKVTLRIYILLLFNQSSRRVLALVRRDFVCRSHPLCYDATDPDPARHVHSTLDVFKEVHGISSCAWPHSKTIWPEVMRMFQACLSPFLERFALAEDEQEGPVSFELLGADILVDQSFRPWLLEMNQGPALLPIKGNPSATAARTAVMEDTLQEAGRILHRGLVTVLLPLQTNPLQLAGMDAYVQGAQRTVDRVVGELGRVQDIGDALRADTNKRLCQQNKMLNVFKTDLEVKLVSVENRYNKLSDDLWSEETGLAKVMHDLSRTNEVVTSMSTEFSSMKHIKASIAQLEKVQEEVNNFTLETSNNVTALQQTVDRMMSDMKEHFQTATNTVAAHNAAMLQEVRTAYQEELHEAAQVRQKVDEFMQSEREYRRALEESICASQAQTEDLVRQVTSEVEEVGKLRRRDRNSQEVEIKGVAKQLAIVQESSQHVANSLEHLSRVMWTMVQCERAASALDLQDDQDRAKIALMGYKEETSEKTRGGGRTRRSRASSPQPAEQADGQTVINVDERCLSCCGKAQTVLSGFKMACLQYSPAPVVFARKTYNRSDLLGVREKMLLQVGSLEKWHEEHGGSQVHESLEHGPVSFDRADIFGQTNAAPISSGAIVDSLTREERLDSRSSLAGSRARSSPLTMPPIPTPRSTSVS